jgi:hypothetical protein
VGITFGHFLLIRITFNDSRRGNGRVAETQIAPFATTCQNYVICEKAAVEMFVLLIYAALTGDDHLICLNEGGRMLVEVKWRRWKEQGHYVILG